MKVFFLLIGILLPNLGHATELMPWFGTSYEIESRTHFGFQTFNKVNTRHGDKSFPSYNQHYGLELLLPVLDAWCFELEAHTFNSRQHSLNWNDVSLTARHKILNDIVDDLATITIGMTVTKSFKLARRDLSLFHHGGIEALFHFAAGREISHLQFWTSRYWFATGVGFGDLGYPWSFLDLHYENNCYNIHQFGLFLKTLWSFGPRSLTLNQPFHGYGPIQHHSANFGTYYEFLLRHTSKIRLEYSYQFYSHNCPKRVSLLTLSFIIPIGLGI